jgi:predicted GNAT family acetyltransferase
MRFVLTHDAEEFAGHAEGFLAERVERNILATVLLNLRRGHLGASAPLFAYSVDGRGKVCAVALRTPPWPLLVSDLDSNAAEAQMEAWLPADPDVPGVSASPSSARAVAGAWVRRTRGRSYCRMREAMHVLREVRDPLSTAPGRLRIASDAELDLLTEWERAFMLEAGVGQPQAAQAAVRVRLARDAQYVWEDGGPVSTLTLSPEVAGTVRIGPVYTPPEHRRHGYASSAVAAAVRRSLTRGARQCMLFTDLANPTSNHIYAAIGFRPVMDWEEHAFVAVHNARSRDRLVGS